MRMSEKQMRKALRQARQQRKPQLYDDPELGKVWITQRALSTYRQALQSKLGITDEITVKHDIAVQAYKAWLSQLQWQTVGQQELLLPGFQLHFAAADDGNGVYADVEPWFPY